MLFIPVQIYLWHLQFKDAWPKTFAEAMCCNIPIICFDKTSISEIVEHKKTGFIVNNFSSAELKKVLNGCLKI